MQTLLQEKLEYYEAAHEKRRRKRQILAVLALVVAMLVFWQLKLTGISMTDQLICQQEEHVHTAACYQLICQQETAHTHGEGCYQPVLVCDSSEEGHVHNIDSGCYSLGCTDGAGHSHGEDCYDRQLVCTEEHHTASCYETVLCCDDEDPSHVHTDGCYSSELVCGEAHHTEDCYQQTLCCTLEEGHIHSADCCEQALVCPAAHSHTDACYDMTQLICGKEAHTHSREQNCYAVNDSILKQASGDPVLLGSRMTGGDQEVPYNGTQAADFRSHITKVTGNGTTYDPDQNLIESSLHMEFGIITKAEMEQSQNSFFYDLPTDIVLTDSLLNTWYTGQDNNGTDAFRYRFLRQDDGSYRMEVYFLPAYMEQRVQVDGGYINFNAKLHAGAVGEDGKFEKPFSDQVTLTIPVDTILSADGSQTVLHDLAVAKAATMEADGSVQYTVTVSSEKGTPGVITLEDVMTPPQGLTIGQLTALQVKKGEQVLSAADYTLHISDTAFIMGLPQLAAGESYTITYAYPVTGEVAGSARNKATASAVIEGNIKIEDSAEKTISLRNEHIQKYGAYNGQESTITWNINVKPGGANIAGQTLIDPMLQSAADDQIVVKQDGGTVVARGTGWDRDENGNIVFRATEGEANGHSYTVTYITRHPVALGGESQTVTNTATFMGQSASHSETVGYQNANALEKTGQLVYDNGQRLARWSTTVHIPEGGIAAGAVFTDTLTHKHGINAQGHYFTVEQVQAYLQALDATVLAGKYGRVELTTNKYYPGWRDKDAFLNDPTAGRITGIRFTVTEAIPCPQAGSSDIVLQYDSTLAGETGGGDQTYQNEFGVGNVSKTAEVVEQPNVQKDVAQGNGAILQSTADTFVWRVRLKLTDDGSAVYTVTDSLPEGVVLDSILYDRDSYGYHNASQVGQITFDSSQQATAANAHLGIGISGSCQGNKTTLQISRGSYDGTFLYLFYQCHLEEGTLTNLSTDGTTFTNQVTAKVGADTEYGAASSTITLKKPQDTAVTKPSVAKSAVVNTARRTLDYRVEINPEGKNLDPDSDLLSFEDIAEIQGKKLSPGLIQSSVKLYYATRNDDGSLSIDSSRGDSGQVPDWHTWQAKELERYDWGNAYFWTKQQLSGTVPDGEPLILTYSYRLEGGIHESEYDQWNKSAEAKNTFKLEGQQNGQSQTGEKFDWYEPQTSAGVHSPLELYKVDADQQGLLLEGAVFQVYRYDGTAFVPLDGVSYTSSTAGPIRVEYQEDRFAYNTLYYMQERTPPPDYLMPVDSQKIYFYFEKADAGESMAVPAGFSLSGAINLSEGGKVVRVTNKRETTQVTVSKCWTDTDGSTPLAEHPAEVYVSLYRTLVDEDTYRQLQAGQVTMNGAGGEPYGAPHTLGQDNNWHSTWYDLPLCHYGVAEGAAAPTVQYYYYYPVETPVNGFAATISAPVFDWQGYYSFTVTNQKDESIRYTLPETGGPGMMGVSLLGAVMIGFSLRVACRRNSR